MTLDTLIAVGIVVVAAVYIIRRFSKTRKSGGCGCGSESSCGGGKHQPVDTDCCSSKH